MATESDDEDLARAIALSLAETSPTSGTAKPSEIIDLTEDDGNSANASKSGCLAENNDSPLASNSKKSSSEKTRNQKVTATEPVLHGAASNNGYPKPEFSLYSLDRKQMEEERLARNRKRKASISPPRRGPPANPRECESYLENEEQVQPTSKGMKNIATDAPGKALNQSSSHMNLPSRHVNTVPSSGIQYPTGAVKKTWAFGYPRDNDIKFEEVLQKNTLDLAILSAFQWDDAWVLSKIDMKRTKLVCVMQEEDEQRKAEMRSNVPSNIRLCFPSMAGQINCMHSKLQLLSHKTHLRVVIPSANLVPYDWGESGGVMENSVFLIDLPRLPEGEQKSTSELTFFGKELVYFLEHLGLDAKIVESVKRFDFANTAHLAFVHSIGGAHDGESWKRTGFCGLGTSIRTLGLSSQGPISVDFTSASIGFLNMEFLKSMYLAAQGDNGLTEFNWRVAKQARKKSHADAESRDEQRTREYIQDNVKIYFPSQATVLSSKGGPNAGGTICFQSRWWEAPQFPRELMRDCQSQRAGMLMHNKMMFVRPHNHPLHGIDGKRYAGWAYVGSANLSESAWGKLVKDRTTKQPKLNCRNWECGVIVPVPMPENSTTLFSTARSVGNSSSEGGNGSAIEPVPQITPLDMDCFQGHIPVPMRIPAESLSVNRRPWFYAERMSHV